MFYTYRPEGVCARQIEFEIDNGIIRNVKFTGGCNGNLKALSILVDGLTCEEVVKKLSGVRCGLRPTSCSDQFARAIRQVAQQQTKSDQASENQA